MIVRSLLVLWLLTLAAMTVPTLIAAKEVEGGANAAVAQTPIALAPVVVDGNVLFQVRGVSAYPAEARASVIKDRIEALARDVNFQTDMLQVMESGNVTRIMGRDIPVMSVVDADAEIEGVRRPELAAALARRIREGIEDYRRDRGSDVLVRSWMCVLVATVVLAVALALVIWMARRIDGLMERRLHRHIQTLGIQSFEIVRAERLWAALRGAANVGRGIAILAIVFAYIHYVLALFPWTRHFANRLLDNVIGPLATMGQAILADIPDLVFLTILIVIVSYVLRLTRFFFDAIAGRSVTLAGFQPEWARPTYKIVRVGIVAFALVVAYPYIPGSQSAAFKGVSLFLGIVFSIGSSSIIANTVAGYALIYRRAFKLGDRVKIGDTIGDVVEMRVQVTHLRSLKNEEVIVPNSLILTSQVVNYSSLAHQQGLILHTTVGIGYETPWRQVEAMLLMAAERTPGLRQEPSPFILQQSLGDFAVNYELNVYCDDASAMLEVYTALHRNILDVFNEYDVQIMTPAYVSDPHQPKVVPKEQWFAVPARRAGD